MSSEKKIYSWLKKGVYAILLIWVFWVIINGVPYFYAASQEANLNESKIKERIKVEEFLKFYIQKKINIKDSLWGKRYDLKKGEYCIQYLIFGLSPIDIVYDKNNKLVRVFSSYE